MQDNMKCNIDMAAGRSRANKIAAVVAGLFWVFCMVSFFTGPYVMPDDPAGAAGDETVLEKCIIAGMLLVPVASVCFAKRLLAGRRFRFAISWLAAFLVQYTIMVYAIFFPISPPEGYYMSKTEECILYAIMFAITIGIINVVDSLLERLVRKLAREAFSQGKAGWLYGFQMRLRAGGRSLPRDKQRKTKGRTT